MEHVGGITVKVYEAVFVSPPPDPVMVILYVPVGVEELVVMVIVDVALGLLGLMVTLGGLNDADAPEGRPEAEKLTVMDELYPPVRLTVTVVVVPSPCLTEPLEGETLTENV